MADFESDTVEAASAFAEGFFAARTPQLKVQFGATSHRGNVRPNNEDSYAVIRRRRTSDVLLSSLRPEECVATDDSTYGLVVADGIGGIRYGEVASRLALQTMLELSGEATSWVMKLTDLEAQQIRERVEAYVQRIQQALKESAEADPRLRGMGTTWTSAHLIPPSAMVVHLGDSRAYLFRAGELQQITRDETLGQAWLEGGLEPSQVARYRHVLLNCLGSDGEGVVTQIHQLDFGPGDKLLLCTDGLYDMVSHRAIEEELRRQQTPQAVCDALVQLALSGGGRDNITVVLAAAES